MKHSTEISKSILSSQGLIHQERARESGAKHNEFETAGTSHSVERMKARRMWRHHQNTTTTTRHSLVPQSTDRIRSLVQAACAARAGMSRMTLNEWRDVEEELERKLEKARL